MTAQRPRPGIISRAAGLKRIQIDRSIPCQKCRYNLRGLDLVGKCPECGTSIEQSVERFLPAQREVDQVERFSSAFRANAMGWAFNLVLLLACVLMPLAIFAVGCGAIARILAYGRIKSTIELLPKASRETLMYTAIFSWLTLAISCLMFFHFIFGLSYASLLLALFLVIIGIEGFLWMSWVSKCADRLECSAIHLLGKIARWYWVLVVPIAIFFVADGLVLNSNIALLTLGLVLLILTICVGSLVNILVTGSFADVIPQLCLINDIDDELLHVMRNERGPAKPVVDEPPVEIAPGQGEEIQVVESTLPPKSAEQSEPPKKDEDDPDTPMGVY